MTQHAEPDSELINMSQMLTVLADRFTISANLWHPIDEHMSAGCIRTARDLDAMARRVLGGSLTLERASAALDAGNLIDRQLGGAWRYREAQRALSLNDERKKHDGRNANEGN